MDIDGASIVNKQDLLIDIDHISDLTRVTDTLQFKWKFKNLSSDEISFNLQIIDIYGNILSEGNVFKYKNQIEPIEVNDTLYPINLLMLNKSYIVRVKLFNNTQSLSSYSNGMTIIFNKTNNLSLNLTNITTTVDKDHSLSITNTINDTIGNGKVFQRVLIKDRFNNIVEVIKDWEDLGDVSKGVENIITIPSNG